VLDTIRFTEYDLSEVNFENNSCLITNPPYGKRLWDENLEGLYDTLESVFN